MDSNQIAFIICVNDETEFAECRYYIDRLHIPRGFEVDVIAVWDAPSMTAGYNAGMASSYAKYKVYMHQDVFIKNSDFIYDLLSIFVDYEQVGCLGMIGTKKLGKDAAAVIDWDTGKILHNCVPRVLEFPQEDEMFTEVQAADGLLLATQYDIPWREDIFDGWDFYDISQCMEFQRAGYKVAIPYQQEPWCYHDNTYSKMTKYEDYRERFIREYAELGEYVFKRRSEGLLSYEQTKETVRTEVGKLVTAGLVEELRRLFENPNNQGYLYLREYESIINIDCLEEQNQSSLRFWKMGISSEQLLLKLRRLKYALKRIEYGADSLEESKKFIQQNYSKYAVYDVCNRYIEYKEKVFESLGNDMLQTGE